MTTDQAENRYERVAYLIQDNEMTIEEAERYCDTKAYFYGIRDRPPVQGELI